MAKKVIKEETLPVVEPIVVETVPVVETEEADLEDVVIVEAEEVIEVVDDEPATPRAGNEVGVVRIVQKTPSGFKLLLETGEIVRVKKAQYKKGDKTIIL
jgi:hypothetical protein